MACRRGQHLAAERGYMQVLLFASAGKIYNSGNVITYAYLLYLRCIGIGHRSHRQGSGDGAIYRPGSDCGLPRRPGKVAGKGIVAEVSTLLYLDESPLRGNIV